MTDTPARKARPSKGRVRAVAWIAGGATFVTGIGILGVSPRPAPTGGSTVAVRARPDVIVRRVLRRVIVTEPVANAPVELIPEPSAASTGAAGATSDASAPTTTTGGS